MSESSPTADVFISHASEDSAKANAICLGLEERGIKCWIAPRDLTPGTDFAASLVKAIESCKVLILVMSSSANESPHVRREVERAASKGKEIIPFRVDQVGLSLALEYFISSTHWLDATGSPIDQHIEPLADAIRIHLINASSSHAGPSVDWGLTDSVDAFYQRGTELNALTSLINDRHAKIISICGIGGIGKTTIARKFADSMVDDYEQIDDASRFEYVIWRSLREAPALEDELRDCILFLSDQSQSDLPKGSRQRIAMLIKLMQRHRCLLVLDNLEAVLREGESSGQYINGRADYGDLLAAVARTQHESCLLLTTRERPVEIRRMEAESPRIQTLELDGLGYTGGRQLIRDASVEGSDKTLNQVVDLYSGNPLALRLVSTLISRIFGGSAEQFLSDGEAIFGDIRRLLDEHFDRLPFLHREIMFWLAVEREPVGIATMQENLISPVSRIELQEAMLELRSRSLAESSGAGLTLQNVVMEYVTHRVVERVVMTEYLANRLVQEVAEEIVSESPALFLSLALMKADAKEYVRETQQRLILEPIAEQLVARLGREALEDKVRVILDYLRTSKSLAGNYGASNALTLLIHLKSDLTQFNFRGLNIRQAYLQGVELHDVDFSDCFLSRCSFTASFGSAEVITFSPDGKYLAVAVKDDVMVLHGEDLRVAARYVIGLEGARSVAFSPDSTHLASGNTDRTLRIWPCQPEDQPLILRDHVGRVISVAFDFPNGELVASGSDDGSIRLWDLAKERCIRILHQGKAWVQSLAFSPKGSLLAASFQDAKIMVWETDTWSVRHVLEGHEDRVRWVSFDPDGKLLATGSADHTIRFWEMETGTCIRVLSGHSDQVGCVVISPDGQLCASCGEDKQARIWDTQSGECVKVLHGHERKIAGVSFHNEGRILATCSEDQSIRLWDVQTGQRIRTLQGYANPIWCIDADASRSTLVSGGGDSILRVWDATTMECRSSLRGHQSRIWGTAISLDGEFAASVSEDQTVRYWDLKRESCLKIMHGHTDWIRCVSFHPSGAIIASGSEDETVRLWDAATGRCRQTLHGHQHRVLSVAFHPGGKMLASASGDHKIRIWDVETGELANTLTGHSDQVRGITFSRDGKRLASASTDGTVRVWEAQSGDLLFVLNGHEDRVLTVDFSTDGSLLASGSRDRTAKIWDTDRRECLATLRGHLHQVRTTRFGANDERLYTAGEDGAIGVWDVNTGQSIDMVRSSRPYDGMNITGVKGLTTKQKENLHSLGAIESGLT